MSYMSKKIKEQKQTDIYSTVLEAYDITKENIASKMKGNKKLQESLVSCLASYLKVKLNEGDYIETADEISFDGDDNINAAQIDQLADEIMDGKADEGIANSIIVDKENDTDTIEEKLGEDIIPSKYQLKSGYNTVTRGVHDFFSEPTLWEKIKRLASDTVDGAAEKGEQLIQYVQEHPAATAGFALGAAGVIYLIKRIIAKKKEKAMQEAFVGTLSTLKNVNDALDEMNDSNVIEVVKYIADSLYRNL